MKLKPSHYNYFTKLDGDKNMLYNSLTGGLFEIDGNNLCAMQHLLENCDDYAPELAEVRQSMIDNYILIPENINELDLIRMKNMTTRFSTNQFNLTIMPTLDCNFACKYCYESREPGFMGEHIKKGILDWVETIAEPGKQISFSWFGGEPLLDFSSIEWVNGEVLRMCHRIGAKFYSNVTTNGYLVNDDILTRVDVLGIQTFQITLDGPAESHNEYRPLRNGGGTFDTIFRNILRILDETNANVRLRVNIDKENYQNIFALMDLIPERYRSPRLPIYFRSIFTSLTDHLGANSSIREKAISTYEVQKSLYQYAYNHGFYPHFPVMFRKDYFCDSCIHNHFVIHPTGAIYKCTVEFTEGKKIGEIDQDGNVDINSPIHARWVSSVPGDQEKCRECKFLPLCQGGCRYQQLLGKSSCPPESRDVESLVELLYLSTLYSRQTG